MNYYGISKLEGEQSISSAGGSNLILRTSWVYSLRSQAGFVNKVIVRSRQQESLRIVDDQVGSPTWACMLAEATAQVLARGGEYVREHAGLYHLAGSGFASRLEWARRILQYDPQPHEQVTKELLPALTSDFPTSATRPPFSDLDCGYFQNTFGKILPEWERALSLAMR